jgi:hypothetical protein
MEFLAPHDDGEDRPEERTHADPDRGEKQDAGLGLSEYGEEGDPTRAE